MVDKPQKDNPSRMWGELMFSPDIFDFVKYNLFTAQVLFFFHSI